MKGVLGYLGHRVWAVVISWHWSMMVAVQEKKMAS